MCYGNHDWLSVTALFSSVPLFSDRLLLGQHSVQNKRQYKFKRHVNNMEFISLRYCDTQGWISHLPSRSCSASCPARGSRNPVFRVPRWGSRWCSATPCHTLRTPLLRHWCHTGLRSCSTAILTPPTPTPREVGEIRQIDSLKFYLGCCLIRTIKHFHVLLFFQTMWMLRCLLSTCPVLRLKPQPVPLPVHPQSHPRVQALGHQAGTERWSASSPPAPRLPLKVGSIRRRSHKM